MAVHSFAFLPLSMRPARSPRLLLALLAAICLSGSVRAHKPDEPPHQLHPLGDFKLENGQLILDCQVSFVTHGTLNADKSNAVLVLSAIGGNHHRIDFLIGPGKGFDPAKYFVICVDAIGNGLTTSPSNSRRQPRMQFPVFNLRDMVESQHRLVVEKFGLKKLAVVTGASMGGMQAIQWGVSHPEMVEQIVAIVPLGRVTPWTLGITRSMRDLIMLDPAWAGGNYTSQPERGMKLWASLFGGLIVRTPAAHASQFPKAGDIQEFLDKSAEAGWKRIDANDWIYQSWAYDQHDVSQTKGFNGDYDRALASIKARTLVLAGQNDLLNPEVEAKYVADHVPGAKCVTISPQKVLGHATAGGVFPDDNQFLNDAIRGFLAGATGGK